MSKQTLAVKYRPKTFDDVTEQESIKIILQQQLESGEVKNAYLFCGGAGTGKTTTARIFADEINKHQGNPIELDAASNSGVDDVRSIIQQAKTKSLDSEYKVFIIDECHAISNTGWQAFLKLIEEPPAKSIFIFCTTDPQKIPKTILSRVQRYDFRRISQQGIVTRLDYILNEERNEDDAHDMGAFEYIAKLADGGMRDAITLMDKCLSYSPDLTIENVVKALGVADYDVMSKFVYDFCDEKAEDVIKCIEDIHYSGKDLKMFVKQLIQFVLDIKKYIILGSFDYIQIPKTDDMKKVLDEIAEDDYYSASVRRLLSILIKLNTNIKWESSPKYIIEATLLEEIDNDRSE